MYFRASLSSTILKDFMKYFIFFQICMISLFGNLSWQQWKNQTISEELPLIYGLCSKEKASLFMNLVYEIRPKICVEIGTFAGASAFPIARALQYVDCGILYTIDAWNEYAILKGYEDDPEFHDWWKNAHINLEQLCYNFHQMIYHYGLSSYCYSIRMFSEIASGIFADDSIDLFHLDGNTSTQGSVEDIQAYFGKIKTDGYICLSNANLQTRNKLLVFLFENCEWLQERSKEDFLLFKKKG